MLRHRFGKIGNMLGYGLGGGNNPKNENTVREKLGPKKTWVWPVVPHKAMFSYSVAVPLRGPGRQRGVDLKRLLGNLVLLLHRQLLQIPQHIQPGPRKMHCNMWLDWSVDRRKKLPVTTQGGQLGKSTLQGRQLEK
jgi:hypothetical protein